MEYSKSFEEFWQGYPRKIAKPAASRAWQRIAEGDAFLPLQIRQDIEKRTRLKWWAKDKTKIPYPATWLNQRRWEDEGWEKETEPDKQYRPTPNYQPIDTGPDLTPWEACLNRMLLKYMRTAGGLDDFKKAVQIKSEVLRETSVAMDEELEAETPIGECYVTITEMFLDRLDQALGLSLKARVLI